MVEVLAATRFQQEATTCMYVYIGKEEKQKHTHIYHCKNKTVVLADYYLVTKIA